MSKLDCTPLTFSCARNSDNHRSLRYSVRISLSQQIAAGVSACSASPLVDRSRGRANKRTRRAQSARAHPTPASHPPLVPTRRAKTSRPPPSHFPPFTLTINIVHWTSRHDRESSGPESEPTFAATLPYPAGGVLFPCLSVEGASSSDLSCLCRWGSSYLTGRVESTLRTLGRGKRT